MVSTGSPLAAQAGLWAIAEGGTAMDAAVAADAVLGVVQPMWTGIGGDAFCLVDDGREVVGFNGSGAAPAALTLERALADIGELPPVVDMGIPMGLPDASPHVVTVPGLVDAWVQLNDRFGRLPLAKLLEPARALAADGYPLGRIAARGWRHTSGRLHESCPLPRRPRAGDRIDNADLAASLDAIMTGGRDAHYEGAFARAAIQAVTDAGGVLTGDDLAGHRGEWTLPLSGSYRGAEIIEHPPNGQGAAVLAALASLDREPAGDDSDPATVVATVNAIRDGMRLAARHVADPRQGDVVDFWATSGRDTVYTAVAAGGVSVSLITSIFWGFGSGLYAAGAVLQNRGAGFSLDPGSPNVIAPGKRPFHTIIPGLVRRDGRPWATFGVVGGPMQPQGHVQVLRHLIDHGRDPQQALDAPRARWLAADLVAVESGFPDGTEAALAEAGYRVQHDMAREEFGGGCIVRTHDDGWLEGGADQRRDAVATGR
jgi:gamma-glutamyltranspeptidase/glutathione hydrolase